MKLKCDKTSEIVREMTDSEKAESIIKLINDYDINSTFLFGWQIEFIEKLCRKQLNNGWILCGERLPEKNGTYIVTQAMHSLKNHHKILRLDTEHADFSNGTWRRAKHLEIIAWQPLPEKYTEESE